MSPSFPVFKPIVGEDYAEIAHYLRAYQPEISELSFGNFYIWRSHYRFEWSVLGEHLIVLAHESSAAGDDVFALPPLGPAGRLEVVRTLLRWLQAERGVARPQIRRADRRLAEEVRAAADLQTVATREHFDYVYRSVDLGELEGRKYSKKRNHINNFLRDYSYSYAPLSAELVGPCMELAEVWCENRMCEEDISLTHEFCGISDTLQNFAAVGVEGGVLMVDGRVQAFALGEQLNAQMAVVHVEKANPEFKGIYPMINKLFVANRWQQVAYINREQDLGDPGLRQAKESYYPDHLVEKFTLGWTEA